MNKKQLLTALKGRLGKLWLLTAFILVSAGAMAEDFNITPLQLNTTYDMAYGEKLYYSLEAPESGTLTVKGNTSYIPRPYTDATFTRQMNHTVVNYSYTLEVEGGKTYYFYNKSMQQNSTFRMTMGNEREALTVTSVSPAEGSEIAIVTGGSISVAFSESVNMSGAVFSSGNNSVELVGNLIPGSTTYMFDVRNTVYTWLKEGRIKKGDNLTLTLSDVCSATDADNKYGNNGTVTLSWIAPEVPVSMTNATVPAEFLSYWAAGNADGIVKLEFDGDLQTEGATATISFGEIEYDNQFYREQLPVTVSGNTLTVDLTGKVRTQATMLPNYTGTTVFNDINLKISGVKDANGSYCYQAASGSVGSYNYNFTLKNIAGNVTTEFTPLSGRSLNGVSTLELFIRGVSVLSYSGVKFEYTADGRRNSVVVPNSEIRRDEEYIQDDEVVLYIPVPEAVQNATNIVVTLADLVSADGTERNITAYYDRMNLQLIEPATTTLPALERGSFIKVSTDMADKIGYMCYTVRNMSTSELLKSRATFTKSEEDNTFSSEVLANYVLDEGTDYAIEISAYTDEMQYNYRREPLDTAMVILHGSNKAYEYSEYELTSIDPDPETAILESADENVFTVTFSGPVKIDTEKTAVPKGFGQMDPLESIVCADEGTPEYGRVWKLTVKKSDMEALKGSPLALSIVATDAQGRYVKGNRGENEQTYFYYSFENTIGVPEYTLTPADGETVTGLYTIYADENTYGLAMSNLVNMSEVKLTDAEGNEVAHAASVRSYIPSDQSDNEDYQPKRSIITLDKNVMTPGVYTLTIPAQFYIFGNNQLTYLSKTQTATYTVVAPEEIVNDLIPESVTPQPVAADDEDPECIESLKEITLTFPAAAYINSSIESPVAVYNKASHGTEPKTTGTLSKSATDENVIIVTLDTELRGDGDDAGAYTITIAAGAIGDAACNESSFTKGHANGELAYTYNVDKEEVVNPGNVTIDPADGSKVESLLKFTLTFVDESEISAYSGMARLYDANNNEVTRGDCINDNDVWNKGVIMLREAITAEGTYTLVIPAEAFVLGSNGDRYSTEMRFTYTIGEGEEPQPQTENVTVDPADGSTVESLEVINIVFDDEEEISAYSGMARLYDADNNEVTTGDCTSDFDVWNKGIITLKDKITTNGTYTLVIPAEAFALGADADRYSVEHRFTYTVKTTTGINGITIDDASQYNVYSVSGVRVMSTTNKADLGKLKAGIYIVNGKKLAVK